MKIEKDFKPFAVKLSFDLNHYINLRKKLHSTMQCLERLEQEASIEALSGKELEFARKKVNQIKKSIKLEQENLKVDKLSARIKWRMITTMLAENCNRANSLENELANRLQEKLDAPLVLTCMEESLFELLANSMDAFLKRHLDFLEKPLVDNSEIKDANLQIFISLQFNTETISLTYTDNAGGFSNAYLKNTEKLLKLKQTKDAVEEAFPSEKCNDRTYFFGKCGKGMLTLFNLLLWGKLSMDKGLEIQKFKNVQGHTSIQLQNNNHTNGAEIILRSPLKPFEKIANPIIHSSFQDKKRVCEEDEIIDAVTGEDFKLALLTVKRPSTSSKQHFFSKVNSNSVAKVQKLESSESSKTL